jgi:hypothetical protein
VLLGTITLADHPVGGPITVDGDPFFKIPQTTAGQTVTLNAPGDTTAGRLVFIDNTGSTSLTINSTAVANGTTQAFLWTGAAWSPVHR